MVYGDGHRQMMSGGACPSIKSTILDFFLSGSGAATAGGSLGLWGSGAGFHHTDLPAKHMALGCPASVSCLDVRCWLAKLQAAARQPVRDLRLLDQ